MPEEPRALVPTEQFDDISTVPDLDTLLPSPGAGSLSESEQARHQKFQTALVVMGQAAGIALVCPGNQVGVSDANKCAYAAKCELLKAHKAPQGELCPIEREIILARFTGWCHTIGADPKALREDQRAVVAELVEIDVQDQRCANILSRGEAALLTQISVKDSNPETGEFISWERVLHSNAVLQESLHTRRRMIMKEWLLTPETKFKVAKAMGKMGSGDDISKKLSTRADKLRVLEAEYIDIPDQNLPSR